MSFGGCCKLGCNIKEIYVILVLCTSVHPVFNTDLYMCHSHFLDQAQHLLLASLLGQARLATLTTGVYRFTDLAKLPLENFASLGVDKDTFKNYLY